MADFPNSEIEVLYKNQIINGFLDVRGKYKLNGVDFIDQGLLTTDDVVFNSVTAGAGAFSDDLTLSANLIIPNASAGGQLQIKDAGGTARNALYVTSGDDIVLGNTNYDDLILQVGTLGTAVTIKQTTGVIESVAGISFDTSNNILDIYEEGTFTPLLGDGTNFDATQSINVGRYTRVGNRVLFQLFLTTTSLGTISGNLRIAGLPFGAANQTNAHNSITCGYGAGLNLPTAGQSVGGYIGPNNTHITLQLWDAMAGTTILQSGEWSATGSIMMSGVYEV